MAQGQLTQADIIKGLTQIDAFLAEKGIVGELCIFGGACMCLAYSARPSTKDVDAIFQPAADVRKAAFEVSITNGWEWNWLNDDVAGFLSAQEVSLVKTETLPDLPNLKILFPTADYLLAMKCLAARSGDEDDPSPDLQDAVWLCLHLGIQTDADITTIIHQYYPDRPLRAQTDFFIAELVSRLS